MSDLLEVLRAFATATGCDAALWTAEPNAPAVLATVSRDESMLSTWTPPLDGPPGRAASPSGPVVVQPLPGPRRAWLVVEVSDEGGGFDLEKAEIDPTSPENLLREDGRGLFLMRRLMDSVERFDDRGNVIRMTLRRS